MTHVRSVLVPLVVLTLAGGGQPRAQVLGTPDAGVRATVDAFIAAITAGQADQFEALAQQHFAPPLTARGTPETRRAMFERIRADFGTITVLGVRILDGQASIGVRGSTGTQARFELGLEPAPPHRITRLALEVGNTGRPLDAEVLARIFDCFYRADPARGRHTGGSGLGLAIVKQLVEAQGGEVWARSDGDSVTVGVSLPRVLS